MHILQPKHQKVGKEKEMEVLQKFSLSKGQLPKIKVKDAGLEGIDVKEGDLVVMNRKSSKGEIPYFRLVVK